MDERAGARRQRDALARGEVEAGIALVRARRQDGVLPQSQDRQLDQAVSRRSAWAIRYGA